MHPTNTTGPVAQAEISISTVTEGIELAVNRLREAKIGMMELNARLNPRSQPNSINNGSAPSAPPPAALVQRQHVAVSTLHDLLNDVTNELSNLSRSI